MSRQKISPVLREALWEAYGHKCIYTGQLVGLRDCHIDHIIPEALFRDPPAWVMLRGDLGLADGFDPTDIENLVPCLPGTNLQKSEATFAAAQLHYFLGVAGERKAAVLRQAEAIERRLNLPAARLLILLEQGIAAGKVGLQDVDRLLRQVRAAPQDAFRLSLALHFGSEREVREIALGDIDALKRQPVTLPGYAAFDGVTLTHDQLGVRKVLTCDDYERALAEGFDALSNYDIKMSSVFEQRCGLLDALTNAASPRASFIAEPRVGVADLQWLPAELFPTFGPPEEQIQAEGSYQARVQQGTLVVREVGQTMLRVEEPEGMGQYLVEVARADFNGDGLEDLLVFEHVYAVGGTFGYGGVLVLRRDGPDVPLRRVA